MATRGALWSTPIFFVWILTVHTIGLYFFAKGFLLSRRVLESSSTCAEPPVSIPTGYEYPRLGSPENACWMPKSFDKAVILVIDALRYDFTVPPTPGATQPFHNALIILHEKATKEPQNAVLFPFIADPPTTTLQRLKGLTTGTLPTFIEAGANFAGSALLEDNFVTQLHKAGRKLVHLGDDTWEKLFPGHFLTNLSRPYDSFLVADLHTVDHGVEEHLMPLLEHHKDEWDVIIGHFLGVDHVGHRFGPAHPEMSSKLKEMDRVIRKVVNSLDESTLLVVMGDHGMDAHGNHGGETDNEVRAALWMYSRSEHFGHLLRDSQESSYTTKPGVSQIDLAPTLSLLLGVPIPFNSLGRPIEEGFIGPSGLDWERLARAHMLSAAQIGRFHREYSSTISAEDHFDLDHDSVTFSRWDNVYFQQQASFDAFYRELREYQKVILEYYKRIWAQFSIIHMVEGVCVLLFGAMTLLLRICLLDQGTLMSKASSGIIMIGILTWIVTFIIHIAVAGFEKPHMTDAVILGTTASTLILFTSCSLKVIQQSITSLYPGLWNILAIAFTVLLSVGFASNSYTVWEDQIALTFLSTFGICAFSASHRALDIRGCTLGRALSILFILLARVISLSRYCREEQLPYCVTTYHRLGNAVGWRLLIPFLMAFLIPMATRMAFESRELFSNVRVRVWCTICMPAALFFNAIHWTLESAARNGWLEGRHYDGLLSKSPRMSVPRAAMVISITGFAMALVPQCRGRIMTPVQYNLILSTSILTASILISGPMGGSSLSILYFQILILRYLSKHSRNYTIGPTIAALLGTLHFFGTGHNATFSSIQWEAAYILSQGLHYPLSPLLVTLNTFSGPIVAAFSVPLIVLRGRHQQQDIIARPLGIHILVYATWALSTAIWAGILRRHLMVFAIFCPRFMMAGALLLIIDVIAVILSLVSVMNDPQEGAVSWGTISKRQTMQEDNEWR